MPNAHVSDLISIIGLAFLVLQTLIMVALRYRLTFAKRATQILPAQIKNIGLMLTALMLLNYVFMIYSSESGHYQAVLLFSLLVLLSYNSAYATLLDEFSKATLNLEIMKKQSKSTADAYMELLGKSDASKSANNEDVSKLKLNLRILQENLETLTLENSNLRSENEEMKNQGFSAKKRQ